MYSLCPDCLYNYRTIEFYIAFVLGSVLPDKLYLHDATDLASQSSC